jgi:alpha-tubulin suppressor-like RCC1 family protein
MLANHRGDAAGEMSSLQTVSLGSGRSAKLVASGEQHSCAILEDNSLKCWGDNSNGRLGYEHSDNIGDDPSELANAQPVNLGIGRTAKTVALGHAHTCVLLDNDSVKCWGYGVMGQLGYDSSASLGSQPGEISGLGTINLGTGRSAKQIAAGLYHTCAILDTDQLKCWGMNTYGQLGYDIDTNIGDEPNEMSALGTVNLGSGRTALQVATGSLHTCVILDNHAVKCWGQGTYGQLGSDSSVDLGDSSGEMAALTEINLGAGRTARHIAAGSNHTCAVLDNGQLKCWGKNASGELGYDIATESSVTNPSTIPNIAMADLNTVNLGVGRTAVRVAAGGDRTCAILDNSSLKCWGSNLLGSSGYDTITSQRIGDESGEVSGLQPVNLGAGRTIKLP